LCTPTSAPQQTCNVSKQAFALHDDAFASASGLTRILAALHLPNDQLEALDHVLVVSGRGLCPRALELFGEGFSVFGRDLALLGAEVGFVAYDDERDPVDRLVECQRLCKLQ